MEVNENNLQDPTAENVTPRKGGVMRFFSWLGHWWMRLLILFLLMFGVAVVAVVSIGFERPDYAFLFVLVGFVLLLVMLGNIIFCIVDLFRKHFEEGFIGLVVTAVLMWMTICVNFVILMQVGDAERWKPENGFEDKSEVIEMTEPLNTNGSLNKNSDSGKISEDSLQN
ncbi:MAG: hypothetical protein IJU47_02575 [Verrucomicrobia bacterium]|nr:hypothetical protein [Verrucomicrobiota bacterium]